VGVAKAAIHQLENRPLGKISIGYFQALGYTVDEDWVARSCDYVRLCVPALVWWAPSVA